MHILLWVCIMLISGCSLTPDTPIEVPVDIGVAGNAGDVNTTISNSVQNIVSQMEVWQMGTIVGLAWLVGWLSPGPLEIIRGFFSGITEIVKGITSLFGRRF